MSEKDNYADYIKSLSKRELRDLILGTDKNAPLLTRDEPKYSRPQILWGLNKLRNLTNKDVTFDYTEQQVDALMDIIEGFKWTRFYNYDYLRFDIKKPSIYVFMFIVLTWFCGFAYGLYELILLIL